MPTLSVRFIGGHYHATPWYKAQNEGAVEWPPSPWRLLRALIATGYAKLPEWQDGTPPTVAGSLIARLASVLPSYKLPPATGAHTRHYMPTDAKATLVLDARAVVHPSHAPCLFSGRSNLHRKNTYSSTRSRCALATSVGPSHGRNVKRPYRPPIPHLSPRVGLYPTMAMSPLRPAVIKSLSSHRYPRPPTPSGCAHCPSLKTKSPRPHRRSLALYMSRLRGCKETAGPLRPGLASSFTIVPRPTLSPPLRQPKALADQSAPCRSRC